MRCFGKFFKRQKGKRFVSVNFFFIYVNIRKRKGKKNSTPTGFELTTSSLAGEILPDCATTTNEDVEVKH